MLSGDFRIFLPRSAEDRHTRAARLRENHHRKCASLAVVPCGAPPRAAGAGPPPERPSPPAFPSSPGPAAALLSSSSF